MKTQQAGSRLTGWGAGAVLFALAAACNSTPSNYMRGKDVYQTCVPCHGPDGTGNAALAVPSIAGMEPWYVEAQLRKFRSGARGVHPDDAEGMRMRPMALSLPLEEDTAAVAAYVVTLTPKGYAPSIRDGDAKRGGEIYSRCATCHGATGGGNAMLNAPALTTKEPWYLLSQLRKFKAGIRGGPGDANGTIMRAQASLLTDEQAMKDVLAHVQNLARP